MPMRAWFARLRQERGGDAVVEFAVALPIILMLMMGITELGRYFLQANSIERGLRTAALYLARANLPFVGAEVDVAENLARTGTVEGTGPLLAPGWANAEATLQITARSFQLDAKESLPVIRVEAMVPFAPMMPGLMNLFGFDSQAIRLYHEQVYIGD